MKQFSRFISILLIVILTALLLTAAVIAQDDETPEVTVEATVVVTPAPEVTPEVTEEPPVVIIEPTFFDDFIDDLQAGLHDFWEKAGPAMALIATILIAVLKRILPGRQISSRTIALGVLTIFTILYVVSQFAGFVEQLQRGVDFLAALSGPLQNIFVLFGGSTALYKLSQALDVPLLGEKQGEDWFEGEKPRRNEIKTGGRNLVSS